MRRALTVAAVIAIAACVPVAAWALVNGVDRAPHVPVSAAAARADELYAQSAAASARPATAPPASTNAAGSAGNRRLPWLVGFAKESVDPRPCPPPVPSAPCDLNANLHLGGYGLGPTRTSTGPLVDGDGAVEHIDARAMAVSNAQGRTLLLEAIENQGMFAAYKQGPYGLDDIRMQVSHDTGVPVASIVIDTDHSHAGPDLIGLWGGVPVSYLQLVRDRAVAALDLAYQHRVPATLEVGTDVPVLPDPSAGHYVAGSATPGDFFDHSQFTADSATGYRDDLVDTQLRVLQAYGVNGKPLGTLINYAAHGTVMDGSNLGYSADWPGRVAQATEVALGEPTAVTMVADVGRTQPPRPNSDPQCDQVGHVSCNIDKLDTWTRLFTPWIVHAVQTAVPVRGSTVASDEVLTRETATNAALLGVGYSGEVPVRGDGAYGPRRRRGSPAPSSARSSRPTGSATSC